MQNFTLMSHPVSVRRGGQVPPFLETSSPPHSVCAPEREAGREHGGIEIKNSCPLCGTRAVRQLKLPHTEIWKCRGNDCGLEFASPQLDEDELTRAYSRLYYPGTDASCPFQREGTPDSVLRQILTQLESSLGTLNGFRLLDYGCGRGELSRVAADFGLAPIGIEHDPLARSFAAERTGMLVYESLSQLRSKDPAARFELIILWNVIEHLRRPWSELREMGRLLRPGGWLLLCTMNTGCLRARIERARWMSYEDPTHFYYFNRRSLERVLGSGGFRRVQEWKPKIRYPHHGALRRWFYQASDAFGVADGLYYLCSTAMEDA